jgi:enoyl-CoA hydratase/carnithine racemase
MVTGLVERKGNAVIADDEHVRTVIADGVATVELNRAAKKNAISFAMWQKLARLFRGFANDHSLRVAILTGNGDAFSAGADISEFSAVRSTPKQVEVYEAAVDEACRAVAALPKATISAVSGACFGGAVALAASTDFRIADKTTQFSVSAVRMGLAYNLDKCARLYQIVGLQGAKRILLTGQRLGPQEAVDMGLVDEIAPDAAIDSARILARELTQVAPLALGTMKQILETLAAGSVQANRAVLEKLILQADMSEDHREAVRAFSEKRKPEFVGR